MLAFTVDTLALIAGGLPQAGFLLQTPIEGLEGPPHRTNTFPLPGRHGSDVSSQLYDGRPIKLVGKVIGDTFADYEMYRKQLIGATAIELDDNGVPVPKRVSFTTMAGLSYFIDVYFDKPLMSMDSPISCDYQITGVASYPFIFGSSLVTSSNISRPAASGYIVPMITPYVSSGGVGGSVTVSNDGTVTAWPTLDDDGNGGIQLVGPLTSPSLRNLTTGSVFELNYTIPAGSTVSIDMLNQIVLLNNSSSLIATKTMFSDWWGIEPGLNTISISTSSSSDTGYATVSFYPPYTGV